VVTADRPLRIALLSYRSKPHCGGQGVYVRHLSRELDALGHQVEVFSGQPYPELDPGPRLARVPSLDLYRDGDPFRTPRWHEYRDWTDVLETVMMWTGAFPEPLTFSIRALRALATRAGEFDLVHDNQGLGYGMLGVRRLGLPLVTSIHHPISVDRRIDLASLRGLDRLSRRRWYGFVRMQARVARRIAGPGPALEPRRHPGPGPGLEPRRKSGTRPRLEPRWEAGTGSALEPRWEAGTGPLITVSGASKRDICRDFRVPPDRVRVIPLGVDTRVFRPRQEARVPGRIIAVASADSAIKGVATLLRAVGKLATDRDVHLVIVGRPGPGTKRLAAQLSLADRVTFTHGLDDEAFSALLASAEIAVVPSLYEGFSLPAVEHMASGTPLVASDSGALPEVTGDAAALVTPADSEELAAVLRRLHDSPAERAALADRALRRVGERFAWPAVARATVAEYSEAIAEARARQRDPAAGQRTPAAGQRTPAAGQRVPAAGQRTGPSGHVGSSSC
jgi:glycosyltransferase involved in cell wall biosynthesis